MYEIHNLSSGAMIADAARRRAVRHDTQSRIPASARWWRRSDLRTRSTHVEH